jgi:hypothetical protein
MPKPLHNEKGVALVTALLLTLISLGIIMALLYMSTRGARQSSSQKRYNSVLEASHGSIEFFGRDLLPRLIVPAIESANFTTTVNDLVSTTSTTNFSGIELQLPTATAGQINCFRQKLIDRSTTWGSCTTADRSTDPKENPDLQFVLAGADNVGYKIFAKIVDTRRGNTDVSGAGGSGGGTGLRTGGVVESGGGGGSGGVINPGTHYPYMYTLEIQGEKEINPDERARLTVLYAY